MKEAVIKLCTLLMYMLNSHTLRNAVKMMAKGLKNDSKEIQEETSVRNDE